MGELLVDFFTNIGETLEILASVLDAVLRLAPALFVLRDASCLFEERSQLFGLGLDETRDHALLDDGVPVRTDAGAEQDVRDVLATAARAVDEVAGSAVARHDTLQRDLRVARVGPGNLAIAVVEDEFDGCIADGLPGAGAVEDDVGHRIAAQVAGRQFAHDPTHGIDHVRFAAAVGAHHAGEVGREQNGGRVDERLETGQLDLGQTHRVAIFRVGTRGNAG